jgi:hypothetical protein
VGLSRIEFGLNARVQNERGDGVEKVEEEREIEDRMVEIRMG